ncbi:MAG: hypothetical protein ABIJ39_05895, partial [Chloroflexota bacterium]
CPSGVDPEVWARLPENERRDWLLYLWRSNEYWAWRDLALYSLPGTHNTITAYAVAGTILELTGRTEQHGGQTWCHVLFTTSYGTFVQAWVPYAYLEKTRLDGTLFDVVSTRTGQTTDKAEFEYHIGVSDVVAIADIYRINPDTGREISETVQYIMWPLNSKGIGPKIDNLCGAFCVAFLSGDEIGAFLEKWTSRHPDYKTDQTSLCYKPLVANQPYDIGVVKDMLDTYGFRYEKYTLGEVSPIRFKTALEARGYLIAGVGMSSGSGGILATGQTGHWVVVTDVEFRGAEAYVRIYNPFMNRYETYDYETFWFAFQHSGTGSMNGIWVTK